MLAAGVLLALCAGWAAADAPRAVFGVGVLRRDGIIVPFAAFNGRRWVANWPVPHVELDVPISAHDVPSKWWGPTNALERWQAWIGKDPQPLRVVQPDWIDVHCTRQIGLRTDYLPAGGAPPLTEQPYPKDGLAVSPPQPVQPIASVRPESDEMRTLIPMVHDAFNHAERQTEGRGNHPVARRAREGRAPDIEAIYAIGDNPRIYYVEAARQYRLLGQPASDCEAVAFGFFWFAREGTDLRALDSGVDLLACNRAGANYMLPLGAMRVGGKLYWLAQFSGWDQERYVVVEIKRKSVQAAVDVWGGSC